MRGPLALATLSGMAKLQPRPSKPSTAPVRYFRPDPLLWRECLRLANGDASRVEVISRTEALVHRA